jgi:hypothetical protein
LFFLEATCSFFIHQPESQHDHNPPDRVQSLGGEHSKRWNHPGPELILNELVHVHTYYMNGEYEIHHAK